MMLMTLMPGRCCVRPATCISGPASSRSLRGIRLRNQSAVIVQIKNLGEFND